MSSSDALKEYRNLSPKIFYTSILNRWGGNALKALIGQPWFKGEALKSNVRRIVEEYLPRSERSLPELDLPNATLLPEDRESQDRGCKM
jgi:hypothetical protein